MNSNTINHTFTFGDASLMSRNISCSVGRITDGNVGAPFVGDHTFPDSIFSSAVNLSTNGKTQLSK